MTFEVKAVNAKGDGFCVIYPDSGPSLSQQFHNLPVDDPVAFNNALVDLVNDAIARQSGDKVIAPEVQAMLGQPIEAVRQQPAEELNAPKVKEFEGALKVIYANDIPKLNGLMTKYGMFLWSLRDQNWPYVKALFQAAVGAGDISAQEWTLIQEAATEKNIPIL